MNLYIFHYSHHNERNKLWGEMNVYYHHKILNLLDYLILILSNTTPMAVLYLNNFLSKSLSIFSWLLLVSNLLELTYSPCLNAGDSWIQTILAY